MANPVRGEVDLTVGEKTFTLRLATNALAEIETVLDMGVADIIGSLQGGARAKVGTLRAILWGALREHHDNMSLFDAGEIIDAVGVSVVGDAVGTAFKLAFPTTAKENPRKPVSSGAGSARSRTGSRSPASPRKPSGH